MGSARREIARTDGLSFWKLLGVGHGNGFSIRPDLSRYGLLAVWEKPEAASLFFENSTLFESYRANAEEVWTIKMLPIKSHGSWSGRNPFLSSTKPISNEGPIAVLTRASVRVRRLFNFWKAVPSTSDALAKVDGLIDSFGIGEFPWLRPATFSLWRDEAAIQAFAYGTRAHVTAIRRRAAEGWYSEELFARFVPLATEGTWDGRNPLEGHL